MNSSVTYSTFAAHPKPIERTRSKVFSFVCELAPLLTDIEQALFVQGHYIKEISRSFVRWPGKVVVTLEFMQDVDSHRLCQLFEGRDDRHLFGLTLMATREIFNQSIERERKAREIEGATS